MKSNIILIGMPAAGKSTVGVLLAKAMRLGFADTDLFIQQKTGEPLQQTITEKGLDFFLKTEEQVLCSTDLSGYVIATGGSAVLSDKAMEHLKLCGTVVFLDLPLDEIKKRITNIKTRGIAMQNGENIDTVYNKRLPLYRKYADITVSLSPCALEETVEKILENIKGDKFE